MNNLLTAIVTGAVMGALVLGGAVFLLKPTTALGSVSGPDSFFPCETHNGLMKCFYRAKLSQGTTTVCSAKSPTNATSTVSLAQINFNVASTAATYIDIGQATNQFATTTVFGSSIIAAAAQATVVASTAPAAGNKTVLAPGTFVNFKIQGGTTGGEGASAANSAGFVPTGTCDVQFEAFI